MSLMQKETARILREQFGRTTRDSEWLAGNTANNITPRSDRDERELRLAEDQAIRNLNQGSK